MNIEEKVVEKFYSEVDLTDEEDDYRELGLTEEQKHEFTVAFQLIAGNESDMIDEEKVPTVFECLGYNFQDWHIEQMLESIGPDPQTGMYSMDGLLDAYETWAKSLIRPADLEVAWNMLRDDNRILEALPVEANPYRETKVIKEHMAKKSLKKEEGKILFKSVLNEIRGSHVGVQATDDEALHVIEEISSHATNTIDFNDFVRIFVTRT